MKPARPIPHPEHVEAFEVAMDRKAPFSLPCLHVDRYKPRDRRARVAILECQLPKLYVGRLVIVRDEEGVERRGCVEVIDEWEAVVRYLDWDDDSSD
jgi:hypothetical protein